MTDTATERPALAGDELMNLLFPDPGRGYLRVAIVGAATSSEMFCRFVDDRWRVLGQYAPGKEPTLADVLAENRWGRARFSPILRIGTTASALGSVTCIACAWNVPLIQPPREMVDGTRPTAHAALSRVIEASRRSCHLDHERRAPVVARIESTPLRPHVLVDEGDRLVALWRLSEPVAEPAAAGFDWHRMRSVALGHRLAVELGGDCRFADQPADALVDLPGLTREDISPLHRVTATLLSAETVTIETLEGMTDAPQARRT